MTLADLPAGPPTDLPYAVGRTVHLGDREVTLARRPTELVAVEAGVIARWGDGSVVRVDGATGRVDRIGARTAGPPVVDPQGHFVAWQEDGSGQAVVAVRFIGPTVTFIDRQAFPAVPSCCDNPFQVLGMTQGGDVYATLPSSGRTWVWNIYEGDEGVPHADPALDSDDHVREVRGLRGRTIVDVAGSDVVVTDVDNPVPSFGIGAVRAGRYHEAAQVDAAAVLVSDTWILSWRTGGAVDVERRGRGAPDASDLVLALPESPDLPEARWEDDHHVLVDLTDTTGARALVRCDLRTGACEVAVVLPAAALVAD